MRLACLATVLLLAACGRPAPETSAVNSMTSAGAIDPAVPVATNATGIAMPDLSGRWIGVEGTYLVVTPTSPGRYTLAMQYDLDNRGDFVGTAKAEGIAFQRDGRRSVLRPTDGDATGLKYLAGKRDCLTVEPGEGYCRD